MSFKLQFIAAGVAIAFASSATPVHASDSGPVLALSAVAVVPENAAIPVRATTGSVTIVIDRWSTEPDLPQLSSTAPEQLLATLRSVSPRVGVIRSGAIVVAEIFYAREEGTGDKKTSRRVLIATDRPTKDWDLWAQSSGLQFPEFTLIDIQLSSHGTGDGRLVLPANLPRESIDHPIEVMGPIVSPVCLAAVSTDLEGTSKGR